MLILRVILASAAVGGLALKPRSAPTALGVVAAAAVDVALGAPFTPALAVVAPLLGFLAAALTLAGVVESSGLAERAALLLVAAARGRLTALYALVCLLCTFLTAAVSLDGAVVLMVPLVRALARKFSAPFASLFLGVVTVANAASVAVPQGNPTNLAVMNGLGLSPGAFLAHMLGPGTAAAAICAGAVALRERHALAAVQPTPALRWTPSSPRERQAALALGAAALAGWLSLLFGVAPWWPFAAAVAITILPRRRRGRPALVIPWRVAAQMGGLLVTFQALSLRLPVQSGLGLPGLLVVALAVGAASAVANNLPVSVSAAALLAAGPAAYAASIGLAVGALATPQGSVATLIATDLAGPDAPHLSIWCSAPLACAALVVATVLLWTTL